MLVEVVNTIPLHGTAHRRRKMENLKIDQRENKRERGAHSLVEPYYAGAKVYVITTHLKGIKACAFQCVVMA